MGSPCARPKKKESVHNQSSRQTSQNQDRLKPDLTEVIYPQGYIQNEEQNDSSIWQRIKNEQN